VTFLCRPLATLALAVAVTSSARAQSALLPAGLRVPSLADSGRRATDTIVRPIAPADIPAAADRISAATMDLITGTGPDEDTRTVLAGIPILVDSLALDEPVATLGGRGLLTRRGLADLGLMWSARDRKVLSWRRELKQSAAEVDSARREIQHSLALWRATAAQEDTLEYTPALQRRVQGVITRLGQADSVLAGRNTQLLAAELELSDANGRIFTELQAVASARADARRNLLRLDSPPLWKGFTAEGNAGPGWAARPHPVDELLWFFGKNRGLVFTQGLLTLAAMLFARWNRRSLDRTAEHEVPAGPYYEVLRRPVAAVALLGIAATLLLYPLAPLSVYDAALIVAAIPLLLLVPTLVSADLVLPARLAIGFFVLQRGLAMFFIGTPPFRMVMLGTSLVWLSLLSLGLRPGKILRQGGTGWRHTLQVVAWVLLACGVLAVVANVVGNVSLADALNAGIAATIYLAVLFAAITRITLVLLSQAVRWGAAWSRYLRERGALVLTLVERIMVGTFAVFWFIASLQSFYLWAPLKDGLARALGATIHLGEASLSLGTVVLFGVVLWAGIMIARLVSGVIELDVLSRMDLKRGVPVTVGSLVRYALIAAAFLLAIAATGVELSRLAILGGALGVGIGFGLQNIVNNFVSGLLLAFERPVSVGDTVQVGANTGEIREIGIRASVIRTFEGAEVIVPNSELVTQDVINWTRTGTRRRFEVPVGIAYGNDPARVISLLADVAQAHPAVLGSPRAFALFTGFGQNSLDFVLRAWTDSLDWMVVRSEVAVAVSGALRDSGIEIPFPQRDLHLRSVSAGVLTDLRHGAGPTSAPAP
jgi:small-conductance mechanosensitive channel